MPAKLPPLVTWGTSPEQVTSITGKVPVPTEIADEKKRIAAERSLEYMGLKGGEKITDLKLDRVFIGSCTNGRIEDLRAVARVVDGKTVNTNVNAMIVPGSGLVKMQAEAEGLDKIFKAAGFEWREPGCSMCLAMNPDKLQPGERCASTSNRNFEGRQGYKAIKVKLQQVSRIVGRPPHRCRHRSAEPEPPHVKTVHKCVDHPNRRIRRHIVLDHRRQQRCLTTILAHNIAHEKRPHRC